MTWTGAIPTAVPVKAAPSLPGCDSPVVMEQPRAARGRASGSAAPYSGSAIATSSLAMSSQPTVAMTYCRPSTM